MTNTNEHNVKRIREFCELVQQNRRIDLYDEYIRQDFQDHALTGETIDRKTSRKFLEHLHAAVDRLEVEVLHCVASGDIVATHKIIRGHLRASLMGMSAGDTLNLRVMDFMRLEDGQVIEHWATHGALKAADS